MDRDIIKKARAEVEESKLIGCIDRIRFKQNKITIHRSLYIYM